MSQFSRRTVREAADCLPEDDAVLDAAIGEAVASPKDRPSVMPRASASSCSKAAKKSPASRVERSPKRKKDGGDAVGTTPPAPQS